jgi:hypothetical protein
MTCQEFHSYFENRSLLDAIWLDTSAELSNHAGDCLGCNHLLEMHKELAVNLRLASQSAPQVPAALDRAVIRKYREFVAEQQAKSRPATVGKRMRLVSLLAWAAAVAAAVVVAQEEMTLFFPGNNGAIGEQPPAAQTTNPPPVANPATSTRVMGEKSPPKQLVARTHAYPPAVASRREPDLFSPAFRSLLYCDAISCGGAMDVIRVELPSSVLRSPQASTDATVVSADVLVGSDGIARAIRIVE